MISLKSSFLQLVKKEFLLEFRQRYAISGIVLYVFSMVFVVFSASVKVAPPTWNVLYWLIVLFASINAVVKSFVQENGNRQLYYYQVAHPHALILAKIAYNTLLLIVLELLAYGTYALIAGNPVTNVPLFFVIILLGGCSFAISLTFISALSAKATNSATMMAILSFPAILPILLSLLRLSQNALRIIQDTGYKTDIIMLLAIDAILLALTWLLFPLLWRE
jgi:heme exporter protein B